MDKPIIEVFAGRKGIADKDTRAQSVSPDCSTDGQAGAERSGGQSRSTDAIQEFMSHMESQRGREWSYPFDDGYMHAVTIAAEFLNRDTAE